MRAAYFSFGVNAPPGVLGVAEARRAAGFSQTATSHSSSSFLEARSWDHSGWSSTCRPRRSGLRPAISRTRTWQNSDANDPKVTARCGLSPAPAAQMGGLDRDAQVPGRPDRNAAEDEHAAVIDHDRVRQRSPALAAARLQPLVDREAAGHKAAPSAPSSVPPATPAERAPASGRAGQPSTPRINQPTGSTGAATAAGTTRGWPRRSMPVSPRPGRGTAVVQQHEHVQRGWSRSVPSRPLRPAPRRRQ